MLVRAFHFVALVVAVKLPVEKGSGGRDGRTFFEGEPAPVEVINDADPEKLIKALT